MQVSHRVRSEVPEKSAVWAYPAGVGEGDSGLGGAEGVSGGGGIFDGGPCAYDDLDKVATALVSLSGSV